MKHIEFPLKDKSACIEIDTNSLPEDVTEIYDILATEEAQVEIWLQVAFAYLQNGQLENAINLLQQVEASNFYMDVASKASLKCYLVSILLHSNELDYIAEYQERIIAILGEILKEARNWIVPNVLKSIYLMSLKPLDKESSESILRTLEFYKDYKSDLFILAIKARCYIAKGQYLMAQKIYESILVTEPNFKPDPRIGLGICKFKMGFYEDAMNCWLRSEKISENDTSSKVYNLLALSFVSSAYKDISQNFMQKYKVGLDYAQKAYKSNQNASGALYVLCSYFFSKKAYENVIKLATKAAENSKLLSVQSDSYLWIGKALQQKKQYLEALAAYQKSKSLDERNFCAIVAMAQVQIILGDDTNARLSLERAVDEFPKCIEAQIILCSVYASELKLKYEPKLAQKAIKIFEKVAKSESKISSEIDSTFYIMYASVIEQINADKALECYKNALKICEETNQVPVQLYNNIGVLLQKKENYTEALNYYQKAIDLLRDQKTSETILTTLYFNHGRCHEQMGNNELALKSYKETLLLTPDYIDAKVRMCIIDLNHPKESTFKAIRQLIQTDGDNIEIRAFFGWYLSKQKRKFEEDPVQRHCLQTLRHWKDDHYAITQFGNALLAQAREISGDDNKRQKLYNKAILAFDQALKLDPKNVFAAQGVAITLAYEKEFSKALMIFSKIREALADISIYVNLGHCFCELTQYSRAIECYEKALDLNSFKDIYGLRSALGRAYLQKGRENKRISYLKEALLNANLALDSDPKNPALIFNVAFIKFQSADIIRKISEDKRSAEDLEDAMLKLNEAITTLSDLSNIEKLPFSNADLQQRIRLLNTTKKQLDRAITSQKQYESENSARIIELRDERDERRRIKEELRAQQEFAEREKQKQLTEERRKMLADMEKLRTERANNVAAAANASVEVTSDQEKPPKKKRIIKKKAISERGSSLEPIQEVKHVDDDDDVIEKAGRKRKSHYISEEFVHSSSNSDEEAPTNVETLKENEASINDNALNKDPKNIKADVDEETRSENEIYTNEEALNDV